MFDEPDQGPTEHAADPALRAREKAEEFCIHAEIAAVFEGRRKFDAAIAFDLPYSTVRDIQLRCARLERAKVAGVPVLPAPVVADATELLNLSATLDLSANDYHVHRRPGEAMIVRWLQGDSIAGFYERLQAHFDVAFNDYRDEERQAQGWKQDAATQAYLAALDAIKLSMADRYLRAMTRQFKVSVLSTLTADELNIRFLAEDVMGVTTAELVTPASAPADPAPDAYQQGEFAERDLAWFFKLFSLRGMVEEAERMCFFAYLQKSDDVFDSE